MVAIRFLFFLLFAFSSIQIFATHNRAGEITYRHIEDLTYEFTITTYTEPSSPADRDELVIHFGDGTNDTVPRSSETLLTPVVKKNTYVVEHTYPGINTYVISMEDPNRVDGIINISGSVNVPFCLLDTLKMPDPLTLGYNSSPVLLLPPIDYANVGQVFIHNPAAEDPDGDSLIYSFIVPKRDPISDVPGYLYPDEVDTSCFDFFSIDRFTGEIVWNAPCVKGIYNIAILIQEFRDGTCVGSMIRDMQIFVGCSENRPPVLAELRDTCVIAGQQLQISITANDPDPGQQVTLSAGGGPFFVSSNPADFNVSPPGNPAFGNFSWQTDCSHIRDEFYQVVFKAEDNFDVPLVDLESWLITVVAPPVENLTATAIGDRVELAWDDPYSCINFENFQEFSVWRKLGCDSIEYDHCQIGLSGTGYSKIADVGSDHFHTDFDVVIGQQYSYRVLAQFAESAPDPSPFTYNHVYSSPSNEACAELKRDIPVISNVSVRHTDVSDGSIFVAWYPPVAEDLDTVGNPPPYKYEVFRETGSSGAGSGTPIATFTSNTFVNFTDTSFIDTFLNTTQNQYNYVIEFTTGDGFGGEQIIGDTENASSIFLGIAGSDNTLDLGWNENVPWTNFEYEVFWEFPRQSGNYELLATTIEPQLTVENLLNDTAYCFRIKSIGMYSSPDLTDTLINFSQINCEKPIDTIPPCPPELTVDNLCDDESDFVFVPGELENTLIWSNPNNFCADDVVSYNIYYTTIETGNFELLASTSSPDDTIYIHGGLSSIAGCYAVTAIDSFDNESAFSNVVCVDNCPTYDLPNVFTPNSDGANDLYTPFLPYSFIDKIDIKIYNRWGGLVFETTDPEIRWDGTSKNSGKDLAEGVYYYVCDVFEIRVDGVLPRNEPLSGYIHLLR